MFARYYDTFEGKNITITCWQVYRVDGVEVAQETERK